MKMVYRRVGIWVFMQLFILTGIVAQSVVIEIDAGDAKKPVSPYIYGKNNSLSDRPSGALSAAKWQYLRDLGITIFRENGGNNATKYNWRRKLSSHPDWYNNVYSHDWDYAASSLQANIPAAQGMWAFQLIGKAAKTGSNNFNDWAYNHSNYWTGVSQNLAGGGVIDTSGASKALVDGNTDLYLESWNADSTTGILDHWFGTDGIGLNSDKIRYWSMDNEPEIWNGTHDDVWPQQPTAEQFMQMYFSTAKKARAYFPEIKLLGPVPANEWQWYNWNGGGINYNGKSYSWLEYFILRIAEEQQASGIRLLDVLDIHFYPYETNPNDITQLHRVYFDTTYNYPGANGVHRLGSGITKEYVLKRCSDWLKKYMGPDHGVKFSVTETAIAKKDEPSLTANWYASTLGEFARQGVEIFTPWDWLPGMSEVVHLFTHYGKPFILPATSTSEKFVSAYPTINSSGDSLTIFLINRNLSQNLELSINLDDFVVDDGNYKLYSLSGLPDTETFISHSSNALTSTDVQITDNSISVTLDPLSVSALVLVKSLTPYGEVTTAAEAEDGILTGVTSDDQIPGYSGTGYVTGFDSINDKLTVNINLPAKDVYRVVIVYSGSAENNFNIIANNTFTSQLSFPSADTFTSYNAGGFLLNSGINTITIETRLIASLQSIQIDRIEIYPMTVNDFDIAEGLIDKQASLVTKNLYTYLKSQFGNHIISGQTHDYYNEFKEVSGKSPMLRAGDFQHFTQGYPYLWVNGIGHTYGYDGSDETVNSLINWYNSSGKKGIVSMQWHWHDPLGDSTSNVSSNTFYTDQTSFDIRRAVIPGTLEYNCVLRDIDSIAFQLKKFQTAGIPVLWRPLHEAGGGWFWWGAHGAEPCLALWDILIERLKNHHQLHNLIWVWSSPEPGWYPGNDKVDLIGYDSYPGNYNYTNQKTKFDELFTITRGEKLIAMTENGPIPDPDACISGDAPWLYFMSWSDLVIKQNTTDHISSVYNNPVVLSLDADLPPQYRVKVKVLRDQTFEPLSLTVNLNNQIRATNASGEAEFSVVKGTYNYLIQKTSYQTIEGTLNITSDTAVVFMLVQTHAGLRFRLREDSKPVNNALVILNSSDSLTTSSLGDAFYGNLPVSQTYAYSVKKQGYIELTGEAYLTTDTVVQLQMTKVLVSAGNGSAKEGFELWPNPANEYINISIPGDNKLKQIVIRSVNGIVINQETADLPPFRLDVNDLPPGIYILQVISAGNVYKALFSKQ